MANIYQYEPDGTLIQTITSARNGDLAYLGDNRFLIASTNFGVYEMRLEGGTLHDEGLLIDNTAASKDTLGVAFDGTHIWCMIDETSIPSKSWMEQHDLDGTLIDSYRCTNDDSRDGIAYDGRAFYAWNRTPAPDELEMIEIVGGSAHVTTVVAATQNAFTSIEFDGSFLWQSLNSAAAGRPIVQTEADGTQTLNWSHGVSNLQGVTWDENFIWVVSA